MLSRMPEDFSGIFPYTEAKTMNPRIKRITVVAMLAAIAYVTVAISHQLPPIVLFLKYDPKDIFITLGGLIWGPITSVAVSVVVSVLEMITFSETGIIGCVMNILSTCSFAVTASVIYHKKKNLTGAVLGLLAGSVIMIGVMLLWNYLITPLYMENVTREQIAGMLIPTFLPFNALKAGLNTGATFLLYKPVANALRKSGLIEEKLKSTQPKKKPVVLWLASGLLILTCILLILVWKGII